MHMTNDAGAILTVNAGSSSVKWALFRAGSTPARMATGKLERIGLSESSATVTNAVTGEKDRRTMPLASHAAAVQVLNDQLARHGHEGGIQAIGHRVVHGGSRYTDPVLLSKDVMDELRRLSPYDPEHLPAEITLMETFEKQYPTVPQIACFDTGFHQHLPRVARILAIPRRYEAQGIRRYGFHGLSYAYLLEELARIAGSAAARGRVVMAHLGNGASMTALRDGQSVDTSMGFTPASGFPMSTRSGDLDPGLFPYLTKTEGMTAEQFQDMVNARSGLLGVSEISPDMRDLLDQEERDPRAAEAVALFCYQGKKCIGAYAAALGGVETVVFSGGIGEQAPAIRARMCEGLEFLGIRLDQAANRAGAAVISRADSRVTVRVMRTDEEIQIAQSVCRLLGVGLIHSSGRGTYESE
jgi:acetate kinase